MPATFFPPPRSQDSFVENQHKEQRSEKKDAKTLFVYGSDAWNTVVSRFMRIRHSLCVEHTSSRMSRTVFRV